MLIGKDLQPLDSKVTSIMSSSMGMLPVTSTNKSADSGSHLSTALLNNKKIYHHNKPVFKPTLISNYINNMHKSPENV